MLVGQRVGDVSDNDPLGEAFDDGRLADARFADEDGVVLGPAGQHLHDTLDLPDTADHRIELVVAGELGEIPSELIEHGRPAR